MLFTFPTYTLAFTKISITYSFILTLSLERSSVYLSCLIYTNTSTYTFISPYISSILNISSTSIFTYFKTKT